MWRMCGARTFSSRMGHWETASERIVNTNTKFLAGKDSSVVLACGLESRLVASTCPSNGRMCAAALLGVA